MSFNTDLEMAYHMGYDDALAKRKPDASKAQVFGWGTCHEQELLNKHKAENRKLREFARDMWCMTTFCRGTSDAEIADMYRRMRELGFMENYGEEVDA